MSAPNPPNNPNPPAPSNDSPWSSLPEDLRSNPVVTRHKDVVSLVKEHVGAQQLIGRKGVIPPASWDDPADVQRFHKELGAPDSIDGYDLSTIEVPEDWNDDLGNAMLEEMYEQGPTQRQVERIFKRYVGVLDTATESAQARMSEARRTAETELRKEWGNAYEEKVRRASEIFHEAFGDQSEELRTLRLMDGSLLGDHPIFLAGLGKLGDLLGEDELLGDKGVNRSTQTPEEAQAEWQRLQTDREGFMKALMEKEHPEHGLAVAKRDALYRAMGASSGGGPS